MDVPDQPLDARPVVGRAQLLLREDVEQVVVVLVGEPLGRGLLDRDAALLGLPDCAPRGALHAREERFLVVVQGGDERRARAHVEAEALDVAAGQQRVGELEVQAAELVEDERQERGDGGLSRDPGRQVEAEVARRPARERAAHDAHAEAADDDSREVPDRLLTVEEPGHDDLAPLRLAHELEPTAALAERPVLERVQMGPVDIVDGHLLESQRPLP